MKRIIKKSISLIAIFWIAAPMILPFFSTAYTQVVNAEESQELNLDRKICKLCK